MVGGCPRGVMVKSMYCGIVVSKFVFESFLTTFEVLFEQLDITLTEKKQCSYYKEPLKLMHERFQSFCTLPLKFAMNFSVHPRKQMKNLF